MKKQTAIWQEKSGNESTRTTELFKSAGAAQDERATQRYRGRGNGERCRAFLASFRLCAAVVAGVHKNIETAQKAMGGGFEKVYHPDPVRAAKYNKLFENYKKLGNFIEKELTQD